jgi:hypothetical protein
MERGIGFQRDSNEYKTTYSIPKVGKKYQSQKNVDKVSAIPKEVERSRDDSNIKKPLLFKKKK